MDEDKVIQEEPGEPFEMFFPITKVDELKKEVWGIGAIEEPDHSGEILDYPSSKPLFQQWSEDTQKRSNGKSKGNVRAMHSNIAAGKLIYLGFDDARKSFPVGAKITNEQEWSQVMEGVYTGFSVGGKYVKRWYDNGLMRYTAQPTEISLVDAPCIPDATFQMVKMDGTVEVRPLRKQALPPTPSATGMSVEEIKAQKDADTFHTLTINVNMVPSTPTLISANVPAQQTVNLPTVASPATDSSPDKGSPNEAAYKAEAGEALDENEEYDPFLGKAKIPAKEGEPKTPPKDYPKDKGQYADPANYSWPVDNAKRCKAALAYYNGGRGKDKYTAEEWKTIGRRIAAACGTKIGGKYSFNASSNQIERVEDKEST